jgi:membrane-bound metal-dependent hydrolase YbcI (DUF457 family)
MQPITYLLICLALATAARKYLPRFGTAMMVTSGIAADLDFISYFGGPAQFLRFHRTVLHSVLGTAVMCCLIAGIYCVMGRGGVRKAREDGRGGPKFPAAFLVCIVGAAAHIILDLAGGIGARLWWPFRGTWHSWDLLPDFDVWILLLLAAGLSLPYLGRMVSEEIGEHKRGAPGQLGATIALVVLILYIGGRGMLHSRAIDLLRSRDYHGQPPEKTGAFAESSNPFAWRGLVSTSGAIDELNISLLPGGTFDPDRGVPHYKPEDSPAIGAAQDTADEKLFLAYARFPLAAIEPQASGFEVTLRDLRFPAGYRSIENIFLDVRVGENAQIVEQRMRFAGTTRQR